MMLSFRQMPNCQQSPAKSEQPNPVPRSLLKCEQRKATTILGQAEECDETKLHLQRCRSENSDRTPLHYRVIAVDHRRGFPRTRRALKREDFRERDAPMRRSYSLDNHRVVLGPFEAMLARLTISGTVVPRLRGFDGRKFENDHSFDFGTLDHFVTAIGNAHVDRVTGESGGRHFRVRFKLFRVACAVAGKNHVSSHEILSFSFQLSVAHLYHAIEKSTIILKVDSHFNGPSRMW